MTWVSKRISSEFKTLAEHTRPYRERFGQVAGTRVWLAARQSYKLPRQSLYQLRLPGVAHPVWLRSGTSDIGTLRQVVCDRETEFQLDTEPSLIIDAGANIGLFSIMMAQRYPRCKVVALEVEQANFDLLCLNAKPYRNIVPLRRALWKHSGHVRIVDPNVPENAFTVGEVESGAPGAIPCASVDALLHEFGAPSVGLLKLDIEGAELEVLQSTASGWIDSTQAMLIELHERSRPGCRAALYAVLKRYPHVHSRVGEYHLVKFTHRAGSSDVGA